VDVPGLLGFATSKLLKSMVEYRSNGQTSAKTPRNTTRHCSLEKADSGGEHQFALDGLFEHRVLLLMWHSRVWHLQVT